MTVFLSTDDAELGKIEAINNSFIVVKQGSINAVRYYFTHEMVKEDPNNEENYTGRLLYVDMTLEEAALYATKRIPNPSTFATLGVSCLSYMPQPFDDKERAKRKG
jgi:hypothetical protein